VQHTPTRPDWLCRTGCGDWPCEPARTALLAELDPVSLSLHMAWHAMDAGEDLDHLDPAVIHRRFLAWMPRPAAVR
jgi:hypothetical protein